MLAGGQSPAGNSVLVVASGAVAAVASLLRKNGHKIFGYVTGAKRHRPWFGNCCARSYPGLAVPYVCPPSESLSRSYCCWRLLFAASRKSALWEGANASNTRFQRHFIQSPHPRRSVHVIATFRGRVKASAPWPTGENKLDVLTVCRSVAVGLPPWWCWVGKGRNGITGRTLCSIPRMTELASVFR